MRIRFTPFVTAAALAVLALPAAHAVDADAGDTRPTASTEADRPRTPAADRPGERAPERDRSDSARVGDDLESCKRDADGMRGPERSRFMTQCLKERK